jgi:uncharacterized membrane protein
MNPVDLIQDWWDFVYVDLLDRSGLMMVLFGWELFIMPIFFACAILYFIVVAPIAHLMDWRGSQQRGSS